MAGGAGRGAQPAIAPSPGRAVGSPTMSAGGWYCTTRYENAHRTVFRELLYPWHPWFGLQVSVHEAIKKADAVVFRCTLSGSDADRWLEVPAWMFERSACPDRARLVSAPFVDGTAIAALTDLVRQALKNRLGSSNAPFSSASTSSHDQNRGEVHDRADVSIHVTARTSRNDATQQDARARPARAVAADRPVWQRTEQRPGGDTGVAGVAGGGARQADRPDGAADPRSCSAKQDRTSDGGRP